MTIEVLCLVKHRGMELGKYLSPWLISIVNDYVLYPQESK